MCRTLKNLILQISREERRKKLSSNYFYECNCDACNGDYPTLKKATDSTAKGLRRQLDKMLSAYQQSFTMGDLEQASKAIYKLYATKIHSGASAQLRCFVWFSLGSFGYQLGRTIATVSDRRPVEHVKNSLQNMMTDWTPQSVITVDYKKA